jgi:hypothetical protein
MRDYDNEINELSKHGANLEKELDSVKKKVEELFKLKAVNEYNDKKYLFDKIEHYLESISKHTYMRNGDFGGSEKSENRYIRVVPFKRMTDTEATFNYAIFVWTDKSEKPHVTMERVDNKKVDANYLQVIHYKVFKHFKHYTLKSPKGFNLNRTFNEIREFYSDFYNFENSTMTVTAYSFKVCFDYSHKLLKPYLEHRKKLKNFREKFNL